MNSSASSRYAGGIPDAPSLPDVRNGPFRVTRVLHGGDRSDLNQLSNPAQLETPLLVRPRPIDDVAPCKGGHESTPDERLIAVQQETDDPLRLRELEVEVRASRRNVSERSPRRSYGPFPRPHVGGDLNADAIDARREVVEVEPPTLAGDRVRNRPGPTGLRGDRCLSKGEVVATRGTASLPTSRGRLLEPFLLAHLLMTKSDLDEMEKWDPDAANELRAALEPQTWHDREG
jgi:hypothetical protein